MIVPRLWCNIGEDNTLSATAPRVLASFMAGISSSAFEARTTNSSVPCVRAEFSKFWRCRNVATLESASTAMQRFEQDPNNAKILDNIFRLVHTIKGTCGFLGLPRLEALAHAAETLMGKLSASGAPSPKASILLEHWSTRFSNALCVRAKKRSMTLSVRSANTRSVPTRKSATFRSSLCRPVPRRSTPRRPSPLAGIFS